MTYLIADTLIRLKNASAVYKKSTRVKNSKVVRAILEVLQQNGWIRDYKEVEDGKQIRVRLRYKGESPLIPYINHVQIFSKPGRRWYVKSKDLTPVRSGKGIRIISTSHGVMSTIDARKKGLGGELICEIW